MRKILIQDDLFAVGELVAMTNEGKPMNNVMQLVDVVSKDPVLVGKSDKLAHVFMGRLQNLTAL